jgi:hypothetical protein
MDKAKISHDILNLLERLRVMNDLLKDQNFKLISRDEIKNDLEETIHLLKEKFEILSQ